MRRAAPAVALAVALTTLAGAPAAADVDLATVVTVESVTDGDTIRVSDGARVRLIGIDTPEVSGPYTRAECFGRRASEFTERLLPPGEEVRLELDREHEDRYGRLLAYVYRESDDLFVNAQIIRKGFGRALTVEPNTEHDDLFERLEDRARDRDRGLWAACDPDDRASAPDGRGSSRRI